MQNLTDNLIHNLKHLMHLVSAFVDSSFKGDSI